MKNIKLGSKVVIKKGVDKNLEGVVTYKIDNIVEVNIPARAEKGKNTKAMFDIENVKAISEEESFLGALKKESKVVGRIMRG